LQNTTGISETLRNVENVYITQVSRITGAFNITLASLYFLCKTIKRSFSICCTLMNRGFFANESGPYQRFVLQTSNRSGNQSELCYIHRGVICHIIKKDNIHTSEYVACQEVVPNRTFFLFFLFFCFSAFCC